MIHIVVASRGHWWFDTWYESFTKYTKEDFKIYMFYDSEHIKSGPQPTLDEDDSIKYTDDNIPLKLQQVDFFINGDIMDKIKIDGPKKPLNEGWTHGIYLDYMFLNFVKKNSNDDDLVIFIDADAFPINDWDVICRKKLKSVDFISMGDRFYGPKVPHLGPKPCLFITTVGWWDKNKFSWRSSEINDEMGTQLVHIFNKYKFNLLNVSNKWKINDYLYLCYGNLFYHHGQSQFKPESDMRDGQKDERRWMMDEEIAKKYNLDRDRIFYMQGSLSRSIYKLIQDDCEIFMRYLNG
jgi:hypothetical protein